jgi:hypothetical protein
MAREANRLLMLRKFAAAVGVLGEVAFLGDGPVRFRSLRIAWSVMLGIPCLLLIAMWVRSYWWTDIVRGPLPAAYGFNLASIQGEVGFCAFESTIPDFALVSDAYVPPANDGQLFAHPIANPNLGFTFGPQPLGFMVVAPYWFWFDLCAVMAIGPWMRWRFSARKLLIAVTIVAIQLGLAAYLS